MATLNRTVQCIVLPVLNVIRILRAAVSVHHETHAAGFVVNIKVRGLRIGRGFLLEAAEEVVTHEDRPIAGHGAGGL